MRGGQVKCVGGDEFVDSEGSQAFVVQFLGGAGHLIFLVDSLTCLSMARRGRKNGRCWHVVLTCLGRTASWLVGSRAL